MEPRARCRGPTTGVRMKRLVRATFLSATLAVFAGHASLASAQTTPPADAWPQRPVRMVVPFPPGGGTDAIARVVAVKMSAIWGHEMVIENKGGGATTIGTAARIHRLHQPPSRRHRVRAATILTACTAAAASANEVAYLLKRAQKSPMPHRFGLFCTLHSKLIYLVYRVCPNVTLSFVHNAL
mgnify:CR=1 FL=1